MLNRSPVNPRGVEKLSVIPRGVDKLSVNPRHLRTLSGHCLFPPECIVIPPLSKHSPHPFPFPLSPLPTRGILITQCFPYPLISILIFLLSREFRKWRVITGSLSTPRGITGSFSTPRGFTGEIVDLDLFSLRHALYSRRFVVFLQN